MREPIEPVYRTLGERIAYERQRRGLTQLQLSKAIGLTRASVTNIELGRQRVPVHTLAAIAVQLGLDIPTLLNPTEPDPQETKLRQAVVTWAAEVETTRLAHREAKDQLSRAKEDLANYLHERSLDSRTPVD